jgi:hypothetical protein
MTTLPTPTPFDWQLDDPEMAEHDGAIARRRLASLDNGTRPFVVRDGLRHLN